MSAAPPVPEAVLDAAGWKPERAPVIVQTGWDNYLWKFQHEAAAYALRVVRLPKHADAGARLAAFEFELAAMDIARDGGLPVPGVVARGTYEGAPFMVMEWLPGVTMLDMVRRRPWQARRLGREFGRLQARLHTLSSDRLRPLTDTDWVDRAGHPALIAVIHRELAGSDARLCHFDFHPLNVLHDGESVTGLLDFTNASASDIRADLGMTNAVLVAAPLPPGVAGRAMNMLRRRFTLGWREGYLDFAGHFPLEPAFEALGYAIYHYEFATAVDEDRGWADVRDLKRLLVLRDEALQRAGIV